MKSTVSEKGRVTIPKRLRERLDIRAGEVLDFEEEGGRLVARKLTQRDGIDAPYGVLGTGKRTDALVRRLRGDADAV